MTQLHDLLVDFLHPLFHKHLLLLICLLHCFLLHLDRSEIKDFVRMWYLQLLLLVVPFRSLHRHILSYKRESFLSWRLRLLILVVQLGQIIIELSVLAGASPWLHAVVCVPQLDVSYGFCQWVFEAEISI